MARYRRAFRTKLLALRLAPASMSLLIARAREHDCEVRLDTHALEVIDRSSLQIMPCSGPSREPGS